MSRRFRPNPSQFMVHRSSHHSAVYNLDSVNVMKQTTNKSVVFFQINNFTLCKIVREDKNSVFIFWKFRNSSNERTRSVTPCVQFLTCYEIRYLTSAWIIIESASSLDNDVVHCVVIRKLTRFSFQRTMGTGSPYRKFQWTHRTSLPSGYPRKILRAHRNV
jgi:hypothetical protein